MTSKLLPLIPEYKTYVEVFGGGASLLFAKQPNGIEVYNDMDNGLVGFFRVLRDPDTFSQFYRKVCMTPYSRELFYEYRKSWDKQECPIERAAQWFVVARQSFAGHFAHAWTYSRTTQNHGMAGAVSGYLSAIDGLEAIHARLMRVQIEHDDFRKVIDRYDTPETFFYLDPPYVHSTRASGNYAHEMSDTDHRALVEMLLKVEGQVMLSAYRHEIYQPLLDSSWTTKDWNTVSFAAARTRGTGILGAGSATDMQPRTETVYMNYENQLSLF